jgi:hypothetical protein
MVGLLRGYFQSTASARPTEQQNAEMVPARSKSYREILD